MKPTILSGIRATGKLHVGNLLGAVRQFVQYASDDCTSLYFIADLHTLTTLDNPEELRGNLVEIAKDYLAAGLDPEQSIIFAQSSVPEISQLALLLGMLQSYNQVAQLPTIKDLMAKHPQRQTMGLLSYPVLMAADILGAQATLVPVGADQVPNVELARDLAKRFNNRFGETLVVPQMVENMVKVPGLDGKKMGKSEADNAVDINSPMDEIRERYMKRGVTDEKRVRLSDPGDPFNGCMSIYPMHEIITPGERDDRTIARQCMEARIGCRECKERMLDTLAEIIEPFQQARARLANQDDYVIDVLKSGGQRARARYAETLALVQDRFGLTLY
ncbi:MAG: hypothetical protein RL150_686 [Candidatus Parcubacteria bacterium]|jgi:tryptophanyl-tRNA synthetase